MNRKAWLISVLCFLVVILGFFWFWFLRYSCSDDWCLILQSRKDDVALERSILDNVNVVRATNRNTNTAATNGNANTNTAVNQNSNTNTSATTTNTNTATSTANIQVTAPGNGQLITSPVTIQGRAREFENVFNYRLQDANGTVLAEDNVLYSSSDAGVFGDFSVEAEFETPKTTTGTLTVFARSARDGSEIDAVTIPVRFE